MTSLVAASTPPFNGTKHVSFQRWLLLAVLVAGGLAAAYLTAFADGSMRLVGPGLLAVVSVALLAGYNGYGLVLALLVTRSSLDWFVAKDSGLGSTPVTGFQPAVATGAAVLVLGVAWLVVQVGAGQFRRPSATGIALCVFSAVCVVTSLGAEDPLLSITTSLRVLIGAVVFLMVEQLVLQRPERLRSLLVAIGLSLVVPALFAINEMATRSAEKNWIQGPFVNRNTLAIWLSLLIPVFIAVRRHVHGWARVGCVAFIGVGSFMVLFSYCRAAWIGLVVAVIVIGLFQERWLVVASLALVAAVWMFVPSVQDRFSDLDEARVAGQGDPNSLAFRERYWDLIWDAHVDDVPFIQNVVGIGLGMVEEWSPYSLEPHNLWVQTVAETGALGTLAMVGLVITIGADQTKGIRRTKPGFERAIVIGAAAASVNLLTQSYTQNLITEALLWTYYATVLAAATSVTLLNRRAPTDLEAGQPTGQEPQPAPA